MLLLREQIKLGYIMLMLLHTEICGLKGSIVLALLYDVWLYRRYKGNVIFYLRISKVPPCCVCVHVCLWRPGVSNTDVVLQSPVNKQAKDRGPCKHSLPFYQHDPYDQSGLCRKTITFPMKCQT